MTAEEVVRKLRTIRYAQGRRGSAAGCLVFGRSLEKPA